MNTSLLLILALVYGLATVGIFSIPESMFSKGETGDRIVTQKGLYRKIFLITGAVVIIIIMLVDYFLSH